MFYVCVQYKASVKTERNTRIEVVDEDEFLDIRENKLVTVKHTKETMNIFKNI